MAFSFMMTIPDFFAPKTSDGKFGDEQVRCVLEDLDLGVIRKIDVVAAQKAGYVKFFIHYASSTPTGKILAAQLADVAKRQSEGEVNVYPKRIEHGTRRDGKVMYWQIFMTATPEELEAKVVQKAEKAAAEKMAPRIV